jgi:hypothetical protein
MTLGRIEELKQDQQRYIRSTVAYWAPEDPRRAQFEEQAELLRLAEVGMRKEMGLL